MVVPGGTVGGGARVAGGLLALGGVLAVVATFLPIYSFGTSESAATTSLSKYVNTVSGWRNSSTFGNTSSTNPVWPTGVWLVLVALIAVAAAAALFATARRPASRARTFAAFGAGILAAAALAQCVPAVTGLLLAVDAIQYRIGVGWVLLVLAAICGAAGGTVAIMTGPRATVGPGHWAPGGGQWGPPPQGWPQPGPQQTGPFPAQPPRTGPFPAQRPWPPAPPRA
jgi:hypothetical protein